ncbi:Pyridoxamine 5'-phosphate oxidase [Leadbetterella byssophila DSM 17132]|uniref:Pyridoxine/pyridoxamine 5'-phosphate oxidase n=1 Tax=Leadbetterella byssophila (strain DSM 17132 / JCM 16389 / KACC 11308 / NBRC 106382 / 4M15) TaxID=649349 RepID=E4RWU1_LEAB4|nr:pyridoxamine 5'-phosphate oxidase [Leadbetterella byssophila]ADQ17147.1 Pyridoxamine 5'-phosphate oxidase [Leadbetterella byssophila DSM 17132]
MNNKDISNLRIHYDKSALSEEQATLSPFTLFELWFNEAKEGGIREPNAMVLSTVSDNKPHARVVLLKGASEAGFEFFTNYNSNKGKQLSQNPFASLTFFYDLLEKQVRIEGQVQKLNHEASDAYFHSRPRGSQIGAWVSDQSQTIPSAAFLNEKLEAYEKKFESQEIIPRPPHWGGFLLVPDSIEFWQGRPNRLHDRLLYTRSGQNWILERLSP